MRGFAFGFIAILAAGLTTSAVTPAQAQADCKDETFVTISGTIEEAEQDEPSKWHIILTHPSRPCDVDELWGSGRLPAACSKGRSVRASGEVADYEVVLVLEVRSVSCG